MTFVFASLIVGILSINRIMNHDHWRSQDLWLGDPVMSQLPMPA